MAVEGTVRFNSLLRKLLNSNSQSVAITLKELEEADYFSPTISQRIQLFAEWQLPHLKKITPGTFWYTGVLG